MVPLLASSQDAGAVGTLERADDCSTSLFHELVDDVREFMGQKVCNPDQATSRVTCRKYLE